MTSVKINGKLNSTGESASGVDFSSKPADGGDNFDESAVQLDGYGESTAGIGGFGESAAGIVQVNLSHDHFGFGKSARRPDDADESKAVSGNWYGLLQKLPLSLSPAAYSPGPDADSPQQPVAAGFTKFILFQKFIFPTDLLWDHLL